MARIYKEGGVFPIAELDAGGVRHPFLWRHKRPTLATALQPFRQFANEILLSPLPGYADAVIQHATLVNSNAEKNGDLDNLARDALLISLAIPLASIRPKEVLSILTVIRERHVHQGDSYIGKSLSRSITVLNQNYLKSEN